MSGPSFQYSRAANLRDALAQASRPGTAFLAGGTDLLQLWKAGAMAPAGVVDISRLPLDDVEFIDGRLSLGALARLSDVATHPDVTRYHPLIARAILASASGQIRNMATVGGNLLQRTRCSYFRSEGLACNKRTPGSGCGALAGENRQAALFGASASCVATHASDLAVALMALDAEVEVFGAEGQRRFPLRDLYRLPAETPERETNLTAGELVTGICISNAARFAAAIAITGHRDHRYMTVTVDDDGPGIPANLREDVFKPFLRLDDARNQDEVGSGLGLAIARDIARSHGGDIMLGDSPMGGLRASVRIPV